MDLSFKRTIELAYGDMGKNWLQQLPQLLNDFSKKWDFKFLNLVDNLSYSFVGLVELNANHELAILKMTPPREHIISEIHCLHCFKKNVPKIYQFDENHHAFLMEYLKPGFSLKQTVKSGDDEAATKIIAQVILALQSDQELNFSFKHLADLIPDLSYLKGHVDNYFFSKAESLFRDLTADRTKDVLLHGDLHHDNVIRHLNQWKVIDPHGYIGDPAAEVGAMIRNPMDSFPTYRSLSTVIENRIKILAEELPFEVDKIKAWTFCMTMLSAAWNVQDFGPEAKVDIEIAKVIDQIKL